MGRKNRNARRVSIMEDLPGDIVMASPMEFNSGTKLLDTTKLGSLFLVYYVVVSSVITISVMMGATQVL